MPNLGFKLNLCRLRLRMCYQLCMCRHTTQKLHRHTDNECKIMHTDGTVSKTSLSADSLPFLNCDVYLLLMVHVPADKCPQKTALSSTFTQSSEKKGTSDITSKSFLDLEMQKKGENRLSLPFWAVKRGWWKKKVHFIEMFLLFVPASQDWVNTDENISNQTSGSLFSTCTNLEDPLSNQTSRWWIYHSRELSTTGNLLAEENMSTGNRYND